MYLLVSNGFDVHIAPLVSNGYDLTLCQIYINSDWYLASRVQEIRSNVCYNCFSLLEARS